MRIVCAEQGLVDAELVDGLLACPSCREVLGPWGFARERVLRCRSGDRRLRPRRARCRGCLATHVLLPEIALSRRQDEVAVIGEAVEASVAGEGCRRIAARLGVPADTVRGWLRRFAGCAELIRGSVRWSVFGPGSNQRSWCRPGLSEDARRASSSNQDGRGRERTP